MTSAVPRWINKHQTRDASSLLRVTGSSANAVTLVRNLIRLLVLRLFCPPLAVIVYVHGCLQRRVSFIKQMTIIINIYQLDRVLFVLIFD